MTGSSEEVRPRTILMVDDEVSILSSLKRLFRRDGYRILTAGGGAEGLEVLAGTAVDVVISDQRMPNMTGVEFLRQVKEHYPETVRIVLSGYTELNSITDAINEGAVFKFLTKPWDDEQLRADIQEAFRFKELADENRRLAVELGIANRELQRLLEDNRRQLQIDQVVLGVVQEILQAVPLPVLGFDDGGLIVSANQEAEQLFAHGSPLIGAFAEEVLPPGLLAVVRDSQPDGIWQDNGVSWRTRYRRLGGDTGSRGWLVILSPHADA